MQDVCEAWCCQLVEISISKVLLDFSIYKLFALARVIPLVLLSFMFSFFGGFGLKSLESNSLYMNCLLWFGDNVENIGLIWCWGLSRVFFSRCSEGVVGCSYKFL